jgi:hypothetical protein
MGSGLFFASLAGIPVLIKKDFRKGLILCSFPLAYYLAIGRGQGVFLRYAIPFIPYFCVTAAVFAVYLSDGLRKYLSPGLHKAATLVLPFLIIGPSLFNDVRLDLLLSKKDNRLIAAEWIGKHLPAGSSVAIFNGCFGIELPSGKDNMKVFNGYDYDSKSGRFIYNDVPVDMPRYIVLEESPVKISDLTEPRQKEIMRKFYHLLSEFKVIDINNPSHWFDQDDNFYVPFAGFEGVQRPGPNIYVYEKNQREKEN